MKGADRDLMSMCMRAINTAYSQINGMKTGGAIEHVYSGKHDTFRLDEVTEEGIKRNIGDYDPNIVLITEETGKMYHGEKDMEPTQTILISDPTDRSIKFNEFLDKMIKDDPANANRHVHDVLEKNMDRWEEEFGCPMLTGASGSIAAIKNRRILFNVMVNYVTGDMFVSSPLGNKYGHYEDDIDKYKNVNFPAQIKGEKFTTFLGKPGYTENLDQCKLLLDQQNCKDRWAPGPMRILQLSDLDKSGDVSFILSNGEKIGEWIGWLSWVKYSRSLEEPDDRSLSTARVFFENPRTREHVLVAPAPHYSIFRDENGETRLNLDMMFQLRDPSQYRETLVVWPRHNDQIMALVKARGKEHHMLNL